MRAASSCLLPLLLLATGWINPTAAAEERPIDFNRDIRPILAENCFACHGFDAKHRKAGLRLDEEKAAKEVMSSGVRAIIPGDPEESELVFRIEVEDPTLLMPPPKSEKSLKPSQIALLRRWVAEGAPWKPHWSLAPIERPGPPTALSATPARNPIDAFIEASLNEQGLAAAPEADAITLVRRLYFDLTGLPPTPEDVQNYLRDPSDQAYENLVERLLASPHYGERMAIFWLDLVRYADSVGYHGDQPVSVSPYRDYVIDAFNANKPFDEFTVEQLAGDLLPEATLEQQIAAGYNRLGMMSAEGGVQPKEYLTKYAAERVRNLSGAWMGVTLGCCECHDHKFDPFTMRDFYRLEAFFSDIREKGLYDGSDFGPYLPVPTEEESARLSQLDGSIDEASASLYLHAPEAPEDEALAAVASLWKERDDLRSRVVKTLRTERVPPRPIRVLPRGNWMDDTGEIVEPGVPGSLPQPQPPASAEGRLTRLELARWLVAPENPLTARNLVNRLWRAFFGEGLSRKLDDLGSQGEPPSHPELLDYLAGRLIDSGWDMKGLIRFIVTSQAYRRDSQASPQLRELDPYNRWLARQNPVRLDAEMIRDTSLFVSGLLVSEVGGTSVKPFQPPGYWSFLNFPKREWQNDTGPRIHRRGLYTHWQRQYLYPSLMAFDAPSREECTAARVRSNTPLQALVLLNDPAYMEMARAFAQRAITEGGNSPEERVVWAFQQALSRPARPEELSALLPMLTSHLESYRSDPESARAVVELGENPLDPNIDVAELAAWTSLTRTILNLHATITRY